MNLWIVSTIVLALLSGLSLRIGYRIGFARGLSEQAERRLGKRPARAGSSGLHGAINDFFDLIDKEEKEK